MNPDLMSIPKTIAGYALATGAIPGAVDAVMNAERIILGVQQSTLSVAIAGTLIGVMLLPEKDAARVKPDAATEGRAARLAQMGKRLVVLGATVLAYAFVAAWVVSTIGHFVPAFTGAPQLPLVGIMGVLIRPMLPKWMKVIERRTTKDKETTS